MENIKIGDIVSRKSYGGDVYFTVKEILSRSEGDKIYLLEGLTFRIIADSKGVDLEKQDSRKVYQEMRQELATSMRNAYRGSIPASRSIFYWARMRPARILHIDASKDYLYKCYDYYRKAGLSVVGKLADEKNQPQVVRRHLENYRPNILVLTGHDSFKKGADRQSLNSYSSSKYFVDAVREARKYQPNADKLCVFAGACQSYYEAIMNAGANFASSPGRILIHALDPAIVSQKIALTDSRKVVTPGEIATLTNSGDKGIWGINTKGFLVRR